MFRGVSFSSTDTHYIARVLNPGPSEPNAAASLACQLVPSHLRSKPWSELLSNRAYQSQLTDTLTVHNSSLLKVFSKFEGPAYVHTYTRQREPETAAGPSHPRVTLVFELPRFSLEFEQVVKQDTGSYELVASDYSGYRLATQQQLVRYSPDGSQVEWYTLPEFSQYLVLTKRDGMQGTQDADVMLLMPRGQVKRMPPPEGQKEGRVMVVHSREPDKSLEVSAPICLHDLLAQMLHA